MTGQGGRYEDAPYIPELRRACLHCVARALLVLRRGINRLRFGGVSSSSSRRAAIVHGRELKAGPVCCKSHMTSGGYGSPIPLIMH